MSQFNSSYKKVLRRIGSYVKMFYFAGNVILPSACTFKSFQKSYVENHEKTCLAGLFVTNAMLPCTFYGLQTSGLDGTFLQVHVNVVSCLQLSELVSLLEPFKF